MASEQQSPPEALGKVNWPLALDRLFKAFVTSDASSTSKWNKFDPALAAITHTTGLLFAKDYDVEVLDNEDGHICGTYPLKLYFIRGERNSAPVQQPSILVEPLAHARFGRVRTRFPMPVILFRGKNVCRSSSLTMRLEALVQTTHNTIRDTLGYSDGLGGMTSPEQKADRWTSADELENREEMKELLALLQTEKSASSMDKHRLADITLIRTLRVSHIADLMMENSKKIVGLTVCSSEKNDSYKRYADFTLLVLPYPGVEFFSHFNTHEPTLATSLHFDWSSWPAVNRPPGSLAYEHELIATWDSVTITQNYLKTMLYSLCDNECTGLLVHCISGWDRTPLFVSLIRLSLWADGEVHNSLSADEMLYLTVAYDWMLFRHQLVHRQMEMQDIFGFCFHFLEHITSSDFSIHYISQRVGNSASIAKIPAPTPTYRPSTISFVASTSSDSSASSPAPTHAAANIRSKNTSSAPPNRNVSPSVTSPNEPKKSFLDGLIITSYHGGSQFEESMHAMKPITDSPLRVREPSDDEGDFTFESDDSPAGSFNSVSFGPDPPTVHDNLIPSEVPEKDDEDVMEHPLTSSTSAASTEPSEEGDSTSPEMQEKFARRKERLDAIRRAFLEHHHGTVHPHFAQKREANSSRNGIWSWIPSFPFGSTPSNNTATSPKRR